MPTPTKTSGERTRSVQVGFLMKAYRESAPGKDGRKGVSQGELLSRMASVDPEHHKANSHSIVSRWESGETVPTVRRLETFGAALGLPEEEVEGLILLAGAQPGLPGRQDPDLPPVRRRDTDGAHQDDEEDR